MSAFVFHSHALDINIKEERSKGIRVTDPGGLEDREMLMIPNCLGNRLTDDGKIVSITHWPHSIPKYFYFCIWY
jgi:hypothetical protein